jgi:non-lysosomal glucosylceramidase
MGLALLNAGDGDTGDKAAGTLTRKFSVEPGKPATVTFAVVWCFPNLKLKGIKGSSGRHYATRFADSAAVGKYLAANFDRLYSQTKLWRDTWYDSTLPHWFLDRTLLNASILASSTAYRFSDGRFYGWEGVYSCPGTCTHVWQYEQAMGRLFPELDVLLRERAEFNPRIGFAPNGMIDHRGEFHAGQAVDGQAGTILRCLRDHQTSTDDAFLKRNWPSIKKATQWLIAQDENGDGILEGPQHNTLDAEWYGPVAWLSGMYLASLRAAEEMGRDVGDAVFADQCRAIFEPGAKNFVKLLFDDGYFINRPDPKHLEAINSGTGCEIDQVLGQSWAFQVGLGRIIPQKETRSALASLWKYNFSPDVGPYRAMNKPGRWYSMPGEAGLLMCSFPRSDWDYEKAKGKGPEWAAGYFNECMNGFEHQVAGHMLWEGMITEGLAIERALHDRYHPSKRNPWNEIECGDHYARSMASYGVFIAASGFEYHGPKGFMAFAPRLSPENFRAAFTAAEGWGSFSQQIAGDTFKATLDVRCGKLMLNTLALSVPANVAAHKVTVTLGDQNVSTTTSANDGQLAIHLGKSTLIEPGKLLSVIVG